MEEEVTNLVKITTFWPCVVCYQSRRRGTVQMGRAGGIKEQKKDNGMEFANG